MITVNNCRFCKLFNFFYRSLLLPRYCSNAETGYLPVELNQKQLLALRKNTNTEMIQTWILFLHATASIKTNPNAEFQTAFRWLIHTTKWILVSHR